MNHAETAPLSTDAQTEDEDCPGARIRDEDIPWDELFADARSGEAGYLFDPKDYPSDEAMMAASDALLLKWAEEECDDD